MNMPNGRNLRELMRLNSFKRKRTSSRDETGGNLDFLIIKPGEKRTIFDQNGPGCINHIWTTQMALFAPFYPRHIIIRIWWDKEENPSVECPLGDFFGLGHGELINFNSLPLQMSPEDGRGMNCWWPMPFKKHAKIEIENDNPTSRIFDPNNIPKLKKGITFYYYVDWELFDDWSELEDQKSVKSKNNVPIGYFHCHFRRVDYKKDQKRDYQTDEKLGFLRWQLNGGNNTRKNGGYDRNHQILEAEGKGQYVGSHIDIDNRLRIQALLPGMNWPGEGDEMIFIDEDVGGEPTLYGTGTEDYVNTAFCPTQKYDGLFHGVIKGDWNPIGKLSYYRYHVLDPIPFEEKIKVTIEHGHNNLRGDIWETTAYWYQQEPHKPFPAFPTREQRMPRKGLLRKVFRILAKMIKYGIWLTGIYVLLKYVTPLL